jgi:hypothetical protein
MAADGVSQWYKIRSYQLLFDYDNRLNFISPGHGVYQGIDRFKIIIVKSDYFCQDFLYPGI